MKKIKIIYPLTVSLVALFVCVGIVYAASYNVTATLGGSDGDFFDLQGTMLFDSIKVGRQGEGGVTFFNGTIINNTTGTDEADLPVTFGDNVRIDGRVYRGATAGTGDNLPFIVNDNMEVSGTLTVAGLSGSGIVGTANLASDAVTSAKIAEGAVDNDQLASGAVTSGKIQNGTIASIDLADGSVNTDQMADDSVTNDKVKGTGGAGLPIAYGYIEGDGTVISGTDNFTCYHDEGDTNYYIQIDGETYTITDYITVATPMADGGWAQVFAIDDMLDVYFQDEDGNFVDAQGFYFITYKTSSEEMGASAVSNQAEPQTYQVLGREVEVF